MERITRRHLIRTGLIAGAGAVGVAALAGCGDTQIVEREVVKVVTREVAVEKIVTQIVEREVAVEKIVTQIVEKEVVVEKIVEKVVTAAPTVLVVEPVEIVLWTFDPLHVKHFNQVSSFWKDKFPQYDITFDFSTVPYAELPTKLLANISAGADLPDLTALAVGEFSKFMKGNLAEEQLVNLTPLLGDDRKKFIEARFTPYMVDGKVYGAENVPSTVFYYYQPAAFEKVGIDVPIETWEDFAEVGKKMKSAGHSIGAVDRGWNSMFMMQYVQRGGLLFDDKANFAMAEPEHRQLAIETLKYEIASIDSGVLLAMANGDYWGQGRIIAYHDGSLVASIMPDWYLDLFLKTGADDMAGQWKVSVPPVWKEGGFKTSALGGSGMTIMKNGPTSQENLPLVWDLLKTANLSVEGQLLRWEAIRYLPTMFDAIKHPRFRDLQDDFLGGQKMGEVFLDMADSVAPEYPSPFQNEALGNLGNNLLRAYDGEAEPEAVIDDVIAEVEDIIAKGS